MLDILLDFEQAAGQLSPVILTIPALVMVIPGLLMWLAGMGVRRIFLGCAGAVSGAALGLLFASSNLILVVVLIAGATVMAVLLERLFIPLFSGVLVAVIVLVLLSRGQVANGGHAATARQSPAPAESLPAALVQSARIVGGYAIDLANEARSICRSILPQHWVIAALAGAVFFLGGLALPRFACAWAFSTLGTMLIFTGMVIFLSYKGSAPISKMCQRGSYYGAVFGLMVALGTGEQLVLFRKAFRRKSHKQQETTEEPEKKEKNEKTQSWRGV